MAADRRSYMMSVELAMKREMAYRKKLSAGGGFSSTTNICSRNGLQPSQVSAPTSSHAPRTNLQGLLPNPNSSLDLTVNSSHASPRTNLLPNLNSSPHLTVTSSHAPPPRTNSLPTPNSSLHLTVTSSHAPPRTNLLPTPSSSPHLTVSSSHAPSRTNLLSTPYSRLHLSVGPTFNPTLRPHFGPRPVQSLLQRANSQHHGPTTRSRLLLTSPSFHGSRSRAGATHQKRKKTLDQQILAENYFCQLCAVDCTSEFNLRMHFKGHKHKAKQREASSTTVISGVTSQQGVNSVISGAQMRALSGCILMERTTFSNSMLPRKK